MAKEGTDCGIKFLIEVNITGWCWCSHLCQSLKKKKSVLTRDWDHAGKIKSLRTFIIPSWFTQVINGIISKLRSSALVFQCFVKTDFLFVCSFQIYFFTLFIRSSVLMEINLPIGFPSLYEITLNWSALSGKTMGVLYFE